MCNTLHSVIGATQWAMQRCYCILTALSNQSQLRIQSGTDSGHGEACCTNVLPDHGASPPSAHFTNAAQGQ